MSFALAFALILAVLLVGCGTTSTHLRHNADTWEIPLPADAAVQRQTAVVAERLLVLTPLQDDVGGARLHAFSLVSGRSLWSTELPPGYDVAAFELGGDHDLIVAVAGDMILALHASTGETRWRVEHSTIWPIQLAADAAGVWLLDGEPRTLTRLDRRSGRVRSRVELADTVDVRLLDLPDQAVQMLVLRAPESGRSRSVRELVSYRASSPTGRERWALNTTLDSLPDPLRSPWLTAPDRDGARRLVDVRTGTELRPADSAPSGGVSAGPLQVEVTAWQGRALSMREIRAWDVRNDSTDPLWQRSVPSSRLLLGSAELHGDVLLIEGGGSTVALDAWTGALLWHRALAVDSTAAGCYAELVDARAVIAFCDDGDSPVLRSLPDLRP